MDNHERINKLVNTMQNSKKYQTLYENTFSKESFIHGHPTDDFISHLTALANKYLERKKEKTEDIKEEVEEEAEKEAIEEVDEEEKEVIEYDETKQSRIKVPEVFKATYDEVWTPVIKKEIDMYLHGKKRTKGFLIYVDGKGKAGKTHWAVSAVEFKGYKSKLRDIPPGRPVYVIEADNADIDEVESKWHEYLPSKKNPKGLIHIKMCYVQDPNTKIIDPEKTLYNIYAALFSLEELTEGTIVLDPYPLFCNLILFVYMLKHTVKGEFDITFDEFIKPDHQITIFEHQYKKKLVYEVLRKLRSYKVNIVLIGNVKEEYSEEDVDPKKKAYGSKKTGRYVTDSGQTGTEYWVDVIGRFYKKEEPIQVKKGNETVTETMIRRYMAITDCRFEEKEFLTKKYIFRAPTFTDVINKLMEVYPK